MQMYSRRIRQCTLATSFLGHRSIVNLLLEKEVDINAHMEMYSRQCQFIVIKLLLSCF